MLYNFTVLREPHDIDLFHTPECMTTRDRRHAKRLSPPRAGGNIRRAYRGRSSGEGGQRAQSCVWKYDIIVVHGERRESQMPEVSRFYGIVVKMFFKPKEHDPSHIHAIYGECVGVFDLATSEMTDGDLPLTAQRLVKEWLSQHRYELEDMWRTQRIVQLPPL